MRDIKSAFKRNLTIPNLLSVIRILVIPLLIVYFVNENYIMAGVMMLISGISDMFDGMLARKLNQVTQLGKMLDPFADKLTLIAVVICINILYPSLFLFVVVLFAKELIMLCGGLVLLKMKIKPPAAKWYGKVATVVFYISMTTIVLLKAIWHISNTLVTVILLAVTTGSMLYALVKYAILFFSIIKENKEIKSENKKS